MAPKPNQVQIGDHVKLKVKVAEGTADSLDVGAGDAGVRYVEDTPGGPAPRIEYRNPGAASALLVEVLPGTEDIRVTLAHSGTALTSTAAQVRDAVNNHAGASALVTASLLGNGTGIPVAQAMTALTGGSDAPVYEELYGERDNERTDEREGIDASHKGTPHNITVPGPRSGEISLTLVANRADVTAAEERTQRALQAIYEAGTEVVFQEVNTFPGAPTDGSRDTTYESEGVILSFSRSSSRGEVVTYDCSITLNAAMRLVA